jgi:hypothetical protein
MGTPPATLSPEVVEKAIQAVKDFHSCFWWWNRDFVPRNPEDVREIVFHLRRGDHQAWRRAQELQTCL